MLTKNEAAGIVEPESAEIMMILRKRLREDPTCHLQPGSAFYDLPLLFTRTERSLRLDHS